MADIGRKRSLGHKLQTWLILGGRGHWVINCRHGYYLYSVISLLHIMVIQKITLSYIYILLPENTYNISLIIHKPVLAIRDHLLFKSTLVFQMVVRKAQVSLYSHILVTSQVFLFFVFMKSNRQCHVNQGDHCLAFSEKIYTFCPLPFQLV